MSLVRRRRRQLARRAARERVPFSVRVALRRAPHLARWLVDRPEPLPTAPPLSMTVAERSSPLRRPGTTYDPDVQRGKEHNVRRAAAALGQRRIDPGARLGWHDHVGPPLRSRGFADGPELHDGRMAVGAGGGLCQVANLVFWLAVHGGLQIVERHRHDLDLFPDSRRTVPFGLGATVFWPHRDLVIANPHRVPVHLSLSVGGGRLSGRLTAAEDLGATWGVREEGHRFVRIGGTVWRENRLLRWRRGQEGSYREELLAEHRARVAYPVQAEDL